MFMHQSPWRRTSASAAVRMLAGGRRGRSARGVEEPGNQYAFGQFVVDLYRLAGLGHMHRDGTLFQVAVGGRVNLQLLFHALGEHHGGRSAGQQFLDVGGLDAR